MARQYQPVIKWSNNRELVPLRDRLDHLLEEVNSVLLDMGEAYQSMGKSEEQITEITIQEFMRSFNLAREGHKTCG